MGRHWVLEMKLMSWTLSTAHKKKRKKQTKPKKQVGENSEVSTGGGEECSVMNGQEATLMLSFKNRHAVSYVVTE